MKKIFSILIMALSLALFSATAMAAGGTINLAWDANTETDLAGYKIYQGSAAGGPYTLTQTLGTVTTATVTVTTDGKFYFVATAFDTAGNESGYSNEVSKTIDTFPPMAPTNLRLAP